MSWRLSPWTCDMNHCIPCRCTYCATTRHCVEEEQNLSFSDHIAEKSFHWSNFCSSSSDHPIIGNFNLTDGNVTFTVPNVTPGDNYVICCKYISYITVPQFWENKPTYNMRIWNLVFGDSGNISPVFAITSPVIGNSSTSASSPTSTDITSTTAGLTSSSSVSIIVSNSASASAASSTSTGWSLYRGNSLWNSPVFFLMCVAQFVMVFVVWIWLKRNHTTRLLFFLVVWPISFVWSSCGAVWRFLALPPGTRFFCGGV